MQKSEQHTKRLFYRRKEVAEMFGLSIRTIDRKISDGYIKATKGGRSVFIYAESVSHENLYAPKPNFINQ